MRLVRIALPTTALALLAACSVGQARDAGPQTTKSYPASNFTKLALAGSYDVTVSTGSQPGVQATGGQNRLEELVVEQDGDTLKIHPKEQSGVHWGWSNDRGVKVSVTVPILAQLDMSGSGDVTINRIAGERFSSSSSGSGDLRVEELRARQLEMHIAGSGDVQARGKVGAATLGIAGSGGIDGSNLVTDTADVSVSGSGNIKLQARQAAKVSVAGSGDVEIKGGAKCQISKAGSGDVRCS